MNKIYYILTNDVLVFMKKCCGNYVMLNLEDIRDKSVYCMWLENYISKPNLDVCKDFKPF